MINVKINGKAIQVPEDTTILAAAKMANVKIPSLCYNSDLPAWASCGICIVRMEGTPRMLRACCTKVTEGMKIHTDNEGVRKSRRMALELLLSNHYADCLGPCKQTCPAGVDVQGYISLIDKGLYNEAVALIKETNPLPAICGRVCVRPCEAECRRNLLDEGAPVGIDYLKRFASDYDLESPTKFVPQVQPSTGKKVAVIGAGPGGLSAAHFLQIAGHQADIYEAAPKPGGWLRYGIPEYRLPNDILDKEVKNITDLGANILYNQKLGGNLSYKELKDKYDAVILTIGSQKGTNVGCDGDDAKNVFSGIDFLKNMEVTGQRYDFQGKTIAVVGGGNTAMDCCRTSVRCKADKVYVIYRRTEKEMPANPIEIHESKVEGVEYMFLTLPKKINSNENGEVTSVTCIRMELGEPDDSGRRRPVPVEGSNFVLACDVVISAISQEPDLAGLEQESLRTTKWSTFEADPATLATSRPGVFAGGDAVSGPSTVVQAIGMGRDGAESIHRYLRGLDLHENRPKLKDRTKFIKDIAKVKAAAKAEMPKLPLPERRGNFKEVELGFPEPVALTEAGRCLNCAGCSD